MENMWDQTFGKLQSQVAQANQPIQGKPLPFTPSPGQIVNPNDYISIINRAFESLGQPATDTPHPERGTDSMGIVIGDRYNTTAKFVNDMAKSFVDRVHGQTGQIPTDDQVKQFIAQNSNQGNAMKFIQGQFNPDQMNTLSDNYIKTNPDVVGKQNAIEDQVKGLQGYADQQYNLGRENLLQGTADINAQQKRGLVEDLASQNQLGQANSRYSLDALENNQNKSLSMALKDLSAQRAATGTGLGLSAAQLGQQGQQFNQQFGLANQQFMNQQDVQAQNYGLMNKQLGLAGQLGQQQAAGQSNNGLAGAGGGALSGAATGATVGSAFLPGAGTAIGAGIGGLGGGLLGYFTNRR